MLFGLSTERPVMFDFVLSFLVNLLSSRDHLGIATTVLRIRINESIVRLSRILNGDWMWMALLSISRTGRPDPPVSGIWFWYPAVSGGIRYLVLVSGGIRWYPVVSGGI
jgi:hypothetical protein